MARRNKKGQFVKGGGGGHRRSAPRRTRADQAITLVNVPAPKATRRSGTRTRVVKVAAPRRKRSSSGGGASLGGLSKFIGGGHRAPIMLGAAALGFAHKEQWLQKLPLVGKAGPVTSFGLLGWAAEELLKIKVPGIVHDAITASLTISAFNIGTTVGSPGGISLVGEDDGIAGNAYPGGAVFYE